MKKRVFIGYVFKHNDVWPYGANFSFYFIIIRYDDDIHFFAHDGMRERSRMSHVKKKKRSRMSYVSSKKKNWHVIKI